LWSLAMGDEVVLGGGVYGRRGLRPNEGLEGLMVLLVLRGMVCALAPTEVEGSVPAAATLVPSALPPAFQVVSSATRRAKWLSMALRWMKSSSEACCWWSCASSCHVRQAVMRRVSWEAACLVALNQGGGSLGEA
jgi:hypothetical protein